MRITGRSYPPTHQPEIAEPKLDRLLQVLAEPPVPLAGLAVLAARSADFQPLIPWLLALPPRKREALLALQTAVLVGSGTVPMMRTLLDERVAEWEGEAPPAPFFQRWRDALLREGSAAETALATLAAADPTQLLLVLPKLLELLDDPQHTALRRSEATIRQLAAHYGTTVVYLRAVWEDKPQEGE